MSRAVFRVGERLKRCHRATYACWCSALAVGATLAAVAIPPAATAGATAASQYKQLNLVSDIPGVARITDPNLVNPWGLSASPSSPLWVADNNSNVSTLYTGGVNGSIPQIVPLVVKIPFGAPTGTVFNPTNDFIVNKGGQAAPANFIFASETGWITAWSGAVSGTEASAEFFDPNAVYKGLELASANGKTYLYAANFRSGKIDVFNSKFAKAPLAGGFTDSQIPAGFAPFDIKLLGGKLFVTYAKQNAAKHDDVKGPGNGFVDVYDTSGNLLQRLIAHGALNSPWGLEIAPSRFGAFSGDLLVGNFGDGTIHAYNPATGALVGQLENTDGNPIAIDGLWSLRVGNGAFGSNQSVVFTAGIAAESHGLLGEITTGG
jgi:uncharacterized protein (TIGR03118 family)